MATDTSRARAIWRYLTTSPDGGPPPPRSRMDDVLTFVATMAGTFAAAAALDITLSDFGAHPVLRLIVSTGIVGAGIEAARHRLRRARRQR